MRERRNRDFFEVFKKINIFFKFVEGEESGENSSFHPLATTLTDRKMIGLGKILGRLKKMS